MQPINAINGSTWFSTYHYRMQQPKKAERQESTWVHSHKGILFIPS